MSVCCGLSGLFLLLGLASMIKYWCKNKFGIGAVQLAFLIIDVQTLGVKSVTGTVKENIPHQT